MSAHAFFAPSSAPRIVECPASLMLTLDMPDTQSVDAAHGTAAHWIADLTLRGGYLVSRYAGCWVAVDKHGECVFQNELNKGDIALDVAFGNKFLFEVDDEMVAAVQEYCDWCNDTRGDKYPECRVNISRWTPKDSSNIFVPPQAFEPQKGTSDHAACEPRRLVITDLKYGKGVRVFAENNYQAVLYALGFIDEWDWLYDFDEIEIRICQPRLEHKDVWIISRAQIEAIGRYILERFELALQPDAPFGPSEKACKFCKASGLCRAQKDYLSGIRALAFEDLDFVEPDPMLLTYDELVEAWRLHGFMQARYDAIVRVMERLMAEGATLPGVRRVQANHNRKWRDEGAARDELMFQFDIPLEKLYKPDSMITPAQAEKLLPKKQRAIINETLAFKPRGGPTIVDAADKRPDYDAAVAQQLNETFDDLDDPFA